MLAAFSGSSKSLAPVPAQIPGVASAGAGEALVFDVQRDFLDHLSNDTFDGLDRVLAADCLLLFPGIRPVTGAALVKRVLRGVRRRYERLRFEAVLQLRSPDDMLVVNSRVRGQRRDGTIYANDVVSLIRLNQSGRVALISDYFKDTAFLNADSAAARPEHA